MISGVAMAAAVAGMLSAATLTEALTVVAPSEGMTVVAERPFTVGWTGAPEDARFDVDLHYCGSYSFCFDEEDGCGFFIASLCDQEGVGCELDEDGGHEVTMPEPIAGISGDGYRVRISQVGMDRQRCSEDFFLMASADAPMVGEPGGPSIEVVAPNSLSMAVAGEEYTVEFDYDNGFGSRVGRFKIDLYADMGQGDCGAWVVSVCDKPNSGCHDTQGDYNVVIPATTTAGVYRIRVGLFGDDSVFGCSQPFEVAPEGEDLWQASP